MTKDERIAELENQLKELSRWAKYFGDDECDTCSSRENNARHEPCLSCFGYINNRYTRHPALAIADEWSEK